MKGVHCSRDAHWARSDTSALGSLLLPAPHEREENSLCWQWPL